MTTRVYGRLVKPRGDSEHLEPVNGTATFTLIPAGVEEGAIRAAGYETAKIVDGVCQAVYLAPGQWEVEYSGPGIRRGRFAFDVGTEPVDLARVAPAAVVDGKELARGEAGRGIESLSDPDEHGEVTVTWTDGETTTMHLPVVGVGPQDPESLARTLGYVLQVGGAAPAEPTRWGVPVVWIDTATVEDTPVQATPPGFDTAGRSYTIPTVDGVRYLVDGVLVAAGVHEVTPPVTVTITAEAVDGFVLEGVTEWVCEYASAVSGYTAVASRLGVQHYWPMDDETGVPRDLGAGGPGTLTVFTGAPVPGATGVGVGPSAYELAEGSAFQIAGQPAAGVAAYTYAMVLDTATASSTTPWVDWNEKHRMFLIPVADQAQFTGPTKTLPTHQGFTPGLHHVAQTWDGQTARAFIDGTEVARAEDPGPIAAGLLLLIGQVGGGGGHVRIAGLVVDHARALSASDIKALSDAVAR